MNKAIMSPGSGVQEFLGGVEQARLDYCRGVQQVEKLFHRAVEEGEQRGACALEEDTLRQLVQARGALEGLRRDWQSREAAAEEFLGGVADPRLRMILRLRYVDLKPWPKVQEELERSGILYDQRNVFYLHKKALEQAGQLWRQGGGCSGETGLV